MYTLGLSQLSVYITVAMNTDGFFSYQCIYMLYFLYDRAAKVLYDRAGTILVLVCGYAWVIFFVSDNIWVLDGCTYWI